MVWSGLTCKSHKLGNPTNWARLSHKNGLNLAQFVRYCLVCGAGFVCETTTQDPSTGSIPQTGPDCPTYWANPSKWTEFGPLCVTGSVCAMTQFMNLTYIYFLCVFPKYKTQPDAHGPEWLTWVNSHKSLNQHSMILNLACHGNKSKWWICTNVLCSVKDYSTNISTKVLSKYLQWAIRANFHFPSISLWIL